MVSISKRVSGAWQNTSYGIRGTATDTITTLPTTIYSDGTNATVSIKGNTVQTGTPTPDNPIMPQGTGERTGNLLPEFYATSGEISGNSYTITKNSIETHNDGSVLGAWYVLAEFKRYGNYANYVKIDEKHSFKIPAGTYTFSGNENIHSANNGLHLIVGELGQTVTGAAGGAKNIGVGQTFTTNEDSYVCPVLEIRSDSQVDEYKLTNPMLSAGSTALPYEPFGVKIPILSADTTTNNYLGEVETTRKIKKLVLDGTETITEESTNVYSILITDTVTTGTGLSTHFEYDSTVSDGQFRIEAGKAVFGYNDTLANFSTFLATQYAAGTPVTLWYVLAESETSIVNEPLMKIEDYADVVNNISIPTTDGANTLSVDTTVRPSEVSANYHGWHMGTVHERTAGQWD